MLRYDEGRIRALIDEAAIRSRLRKVNIAKDAPMA